MSDLIENLKKLCTAHEKELNTLRDKIREIEYVPKAKALIGKCFKYPNSYGFGTKRFWAYKRVVSAKAELLRVDSFQEEVYGKIEINYDSQESAAYFSNRTWIPISEKEYFTAQAKLIKKIIEHNKKRII